MIDTSIRHYHDDVIIERRRPAHWGLVGDYLNQPGLLKTKIYLEVFDPEAGNPADCDYRFFHLRVFVLVKKCLGIAGEPMEMEVSFQSRLCHCLFCDRNSLNSSLVSINIHHNHASQ